MKPVFLELIVIALACLIVSSPVLANGGSSCEPNCVSTARPTATTQTLYSNLKVDPNAYPRIVTMRGSFWNYTLSNSSMILFIKDSNLVFSSGPNIIAVPFIGLELNNLILRSGIVAGEKITVSARCTGTSNTFVKFTSFDYTIMTQRCQVVSLTVPLPPPPPPPPVYTEPVYVDPSYDGYSYNYYY